MNYIMNNMLSNLPKNREAISEYFLQYQCGEMKAREKIILYNIRLVYYIVRKYRNTCYPMEDLFSIGLIGLIKAVDTFNIEKNIKFTTYAGTCINNEILMFLRKSKKNEREISLNTTFITNDEAQTPLQDLVIDDKVNILLNYEEKETKKELLEIISQLSEQEKEAIRLFFGFDGRIYVQREIAEILNVSQSYASRIIKRALQKIQNKLKTSNRCEIFDVLALKHDYQKAILLLQEPQYVKMFSSFTTKQALILQLKLGFVDGKQYNNKVLAEFFKIEEKEIQEMYMNFLKTKQKTYRK